MSDFPRPRTVKELKSFLGLIEFQRKFIEGCSGLSKPLTCLTGAKGRVVLKWTDSMINAFERLKEKVVEDIESDWQ